MGAQKKRLTRAQAAATQDDPAAAAFPIPGAPCDLSHLPRPPTEPIVIISLPKWLRGKNAAASGCVPLKQEAAAFGKMLMLMAARDVDRKRFARLLTAIEKGEDLDGPSAEVIKQMAACTTAVFLTLQQEQVLVASYGQQEMSANFKAKAKAVEFSKQLLDCGEDLKAAAAIGRQILAEAAAAHMEQLPPWQKQWAAADAAAAAAVGGWFGGGAGSIMG